MENKKRGHFQTQINHLQRKGALLQKRLREYAEEAKADGRPIGTLRTVFFFGLIFTLGATFLYAMAFYLNYLTFSEMGFVSIELAVVVTLAAFLIFELGLQAFGSWYWGNNWKYLPLFIISSLAGVLLVVCQIFIGYIRGGLVEEAAIVNPGLISFLFPILTVGMELAGCAVFHQGLSNLMSSGYTLYLHQKTRRTEEKMLETARKIEELKAEMESMEAASGEGGEIGEVEYKRVILKRTGIVLLAIAVILFWIGVSRTHAAECRVILLDLSKSSEATDQSQMGSEFEKNIAATLKIIKEKDTGGWVTVAGITDQSFSNPLILLDRQFPENAGLFGEKREFERKRTVKEFKKIAGYITPSYNRTDIFGAVALAKNYFRDSCQEKRLYVLSDMRHTANGINMEDSADVTQDLIIKAEKGGMITPLDNIEVYVMGVHTIGKDAAYIESLERFWRTYFIKAGANLKTFTILREGER